MKAKLTRSDGSVLEAEGTAEELRQLLEPLQGFPTTTQVPVYVPGVCLRPHLDTQWPAGIYCGDLPGTVGMGQQNMGQLGDGSYTVSPATAEDIAAMRMAMFG